MANNYEVHEGRPSWHQQKAGHISAGVTSGFDTRAEAETFADRCRALRPNEPVFVRESSESRNRAIESAQLTRWADRPDMDTMYYTLPRGADARVNRFAELRQRNYEVCTSGETPADDARVTTWLGTVTGKITSARVYRHNLGGRFVCMQVTATNGARYYGRASFDNGACIVLRKRKSSR